MVAFSTTINERMQLTASKSRIQLKMNRRDTLQLIYTQCEHERIFRSIYVRMTAVSFIHFLLRLVLFSAFFCVFCLVTGFHLLFVFFSWEKTQNQFNNQKLNVRFFFARIRPGELACNRSENNRLHANYLTNANMLLNLWKLPFHVDSLKFWD